MIVPHEPYKPETRKGRIAYSAILAITIGVVMILISSVLISAISNSLPPEEFVIVDKAHIPAVYTFFNLKWSDDQYRLYFNHDMDYGWVPVNQTTYDRYQIGDWFNETIIYESW